MKPIQIITLLLGMFGITISGYSTGGDDRGTNTAVQECGTRVNIECNRTDEVCRSRTMNTCLAEKARLSPHPGLEKRVPRRR